MSVLHFIPYSWINFWPSTLWKSFNLPTEIKFNNHRHSYSSRCKISRFYLSTTVIQCSFTWKPTQQDHWNEHHWQNKERSGETNETSEPQQNFAWCKKKSDNIFSIQGRVFTQIRLRRLLKSKNIMTAQMKYGTENEPVAAKTYSEITGHSVYLCGFVINPSAPYLGTSPDRKVFDPNGIPQFGLLEIKCPSKDSFTERK